MKLVFKKAHDLFRPAFDQSPKTKSTLKKESLIMKRIIKDIQPVIKFLDHRIVVEEMDREDFYIYGTPSKRKRIINYYTEDSEIINGIRIGMNNQDKMNIFEFGIDAMEKIPFGESFVYSFKNPKPIMIEKVYLEGTEIYLLRNGDIIKFERSGYQDYFYFFEKNFHLTDSKKLTVEEYLRHTSIRNLIIWILFAYEEAINRNENKYPILKKSLQALITIMGENNLLI